MKKALVWFGCALGTAAIAAGGYFGYKKLKGNATEITAEDAPAEEKQEA